VWNCCCRRRRNRTAGHGTDFLPDARDRSASLQQYHQPQYHQPLPIFKDVEKAEGGVDFVPVKNLWVVLQPDQTADLAVASEARLRDAAVQVGQASSELGHAWRRRRAHLEVSPRRGDAQAGPTAPQPSPRDLVSVSVRASVMYAAAPAWQTPREEDTEAAAAESGGELPASRLTATTTADAPGTSPPLAPRDLGSVLLSYPLRLVKRAGSSTRKKGWKSVQDAGCQTDRDGYIGRSPCTPR
jgi:hypothetical protein